MRQKDLQEGPFSSFRQGLAKGYQATQSGGAIGPDVFGGKIKDFFTKVDKDSEKEKPAKVTKQPVKKEKPKKNIIVDFNSIPNMTSYKDPKTGMLFTYDEKQSKWMSRDGATELSAKDGAIAFNRAKEKTKLESEDKNMKKSVKEGLADLAHKAEADHEVQMARADLYKIAKYAIKLHDMLKQVSEEQGLEGWQQAKITKASDYISSVYHNLDYEMKFGGQNKMAEPDISAVESADPYKQKLASRLEEKAKSKAQQKFMGMVYAAKKGETPASPEVAKAAKGMSKKAAKDYAATKHKGKPEHVKKD